ncbi:amidohydrolase [Demequina sp. NBRC 110051]|uniref:amidohydrolase n=1 Tax=Demequina sp. NBRC 110051 TaxID=1570340 RepID=UPI001F25BC4F|nr:amidohydrolase family protein [Demequina sp. NBRC 110051]
MTIRDGVIAVLAPAGEAPRTGEVRDFEGRWVGPGLWDSHVHFTQQVIRRMRVDLDGCAGPQEALDRMRTAREIGAPFLGGLLVGYGFRDALWSSPTTLAAFDAAVPDVPAVMISGDLHCGWMNTAAAARLGVDIDSSGLLREAPMVAALGVIDGNIELPVSAFQEAAKAGAARGLVGVVDFENADNVAQWPARTAEGFDALRVEVAAWPDRLDDVIARGIRTGDIVDDAGLVTFGRLKVVADGSLNTRTAWCWDPYPGTDSADVEAYGLPGVTPGGLRVLLSRAHEAGIEAAVHAIGDRTNTEALDAFADLGIGGVIEHAQLVRDQDLARFGALGVTASIQPEHAMDDRDIADHVWAGRSDRAFAFGALHRAGARLRLGSDAPVAPLDPWMSIAAAVFRTRDGREPWHPELCLPLDVALASSSRTTLAVGQPADLVVTDRDPYTCGPDELRAMGVAATFVGGRCTWSSDVEASSSGTAA